MENSIEESACANKSQNQRKKLRFFASFSQSFPKYTPFLLKSAILQLHSEKCLRYAQSLTSIQANVGALPRPQREQKNRAVFCFFTDFSASSKGNGSVFSILFVCAFSDFNHPNRRPSHLCRLCHHGRLYRPSNHHHDRYPSSGSFHPLP